MMPGRWTGVGPVVFALGLAGCSEPSSTSAPANATAADNAIFERDLEIAKLRARVAALEAEEPAKAVPKPAEQQPEPAASARPVVDMCFKDYCPCDLPQEGPDMPLCDQLEQGIEPDVQSMIAGRAMRAARRQMETGDY